jgi:antitoxin component YwqK of YwqJK toxin-antitoxin module
MKNKIGGPIWIGCAWLCALCVSCGKSPSTQMVYWDDSQRVPKRQESYDTQGRQHGEWKTWFTNGQLQSRMVFRHGMIELMEGWYPNGKRAYLQPFKDGLAHGQWTWWDTNGNRLTNSVFRFGTGTEYFYNDDGSLRRIRRWDRGRIVEEIEFGPRERVGKWSRKKRGESIVT